MTSTVILRFDLADWPAVLAMLRATFDAISGARACSMELRYSPSISEVFFNELKSNRDIEMAQSSNEPLLWKFPGWLLVVAGAGFFVLYLLHELTGLTVAATATTLAYYAFASFGATMIAWGLLLLRAASDPTLRDAMAMPTAIGFVLLAAMRVVPLISGSGALDLIPPTLRIPITAGEVVLFGFLAYAFWTRARPS